MLFSSLFTHVGITSRWWSEIATFDPPLLTTYKKGFSSSPVDRDDGPEKRLFVAPDSCTVLHFNSFDQLVSSFIHPSLMLNHHDHRRKQQAASSWDMTHTLNVVIHTRFKSWSSFLPLEERRSLRSLVSPVRLLPGFGSRQHIIWMIIMISSESNLLMIFHRLIHHSGCLFNLPQDLIQKDSDGHIHNHDVEQIYTLIIGSPSLWCGNGWLTSRDRSSLFSSCFLFNIPFIRWCG